MVELRIIGTPEEVGIMTELLRYGTGLYVNAGGPDVRSRKQRGYILRYMTAEPVIGDDLTLDETEALARACTGLDEAQWQNALGWAKDKRADHRVLRDVLRGYDRIASCDSFHAHLKETEYGKKRRNRGGTK